MLLSRCATRMHTQASAVGARQFWLPCEAKVGVAFRNCMTAGGVLPPFKQLAEPAEVSNLLPHLTEGHVNPTQQVHLLPCHGMA